jgi:hypothetical protein
MGDVPLPQGLVLRCDSFGAFSFPISVLLKDCWNLRDQQRKLLCERSSPVS